MKERIHTPVFFGMVTGLVMALLALPVLWNLGVFGLLHLPQPWLGVLVLLWCIGVPLGLALVLHVIMLLPLPYAIKHEFARYGVIGVMNTLLNLCIFNLLLYWSGTATGPLITLFAAMTFAIVVTHGFFWNKYLVFRSHSQARAHKEYIYFFVVSGGVAIINVGVVSFLINGIGAPVGISPTLWANIAVLVTIPIAVLGNFTGYKLLVFKKPKLL